MPQNVILKTTFNSNATGYDRYRPTYPAALFAKLIADTKLTPTARLLEIGPGTGQATKPLADHGYAITAVELGEQLADYTRRAVAKYPNVNVITSAFEDVVLPKNHFDLIFSATAFHWIRPEAQFTKPHQLLKPDGHLAIIHTEHVSDEHGDQFFHMTHPIYRKWTYSPEELIKEPVHKLPRTAELTPPTLDTALFDLQSFTSFPITISYTSDAYIGLIDTYSSTLKLPKHRRDGFLQALKDLIDMSFNGHVTRHFAMTLTIAQKI